MSRSSSGGDWRRGNTQFPRSPRSHGTPGSKSPARRRAHRSTPTRSQAGDLVSKYGVQASATDLEAPPLGPNPPPGDSTLGSSAPHSPPRSESKRLVERPSSSDTGHNAQLATKGSVQQSPVNRPVYSEHVPVTPGRGKPGTGQMTGTRCTVSPTTLDKPGSLTTPGSPVTPGALVGTVNTGQKAQKEKADQCLDRSELPVLNSPARSVQLEHNVHEPLGNMPSLLLEHSPEHSQVFQDLTNSDSQYDRADESLEQSHMRHSVHPSSGIGHTGNHPDHEHSVHRSRLVRSDAREHWSNRTRHRSDVSRSSRRDSNTHRETIPHRHADPGEHSPALMLRHRHARSRSRSYDSVSPRRHIRSPSRSRGKKKSHKKRKHSSTSSSSSRRSSSSSSRERERKRHKSKKKKKKHSKSCSSKRDKREKKHKRKRSPSPSLSSSSSSISSDSSSSLQRSLAKKKSRINSRSPSPADDNPHSASRTASPVSHRDHLSLYADNDDKFYSHSEDNQDLAPDTEIQNVSKIQSDVSTDDMRFQNLVEEVLKLLPADMFPKKTEEFLGGNRPRSSIELEMQKATKQNISLPQSRRPLIKAVDCLKESLGASEVDGSFPMPPTITQDWLPSTADIKKLVKLKYYQAHNEFVPTATASVLDPDANRLDMSLTGSYPVKVSALKDIETHSRDIIRLLSHAEIFSFAAFKSLQSENMDSRSY